MAARTLFLHVGLHKTGTTALQIALAENLDSLAAQGYTFPLTGRKWNPGGHHNLAWEITGDRRFHPEYGTLSDLLIEVKHGPAQVILSSEDFTGALQDGEQFLNFSRPLHAVFSDVCIVVFLRNQVDYCASLYSELLFHGFDRSFESVLDEVAANGTLRWREWCYPFDFEKFLSKITAMEGIRLKVCSYDMCSPGHLWEAFSKACELPPATDLGSLTVENPRRNGGWCLAQFVRNRLAEREDSAQSLILSRIEETWKNKSFDLTAGHREFLSQTFRKSNQSVSEKFGIPLNDFLDKSALPAASRTKFYSLPSTFFRSETDQLFADLAGVIGTELKKTDILESAIEEQRSAAQIATDRLHEEELKLGAANLNIEALATELAIAQAERDAAERQVQALRAENEAIARERQAIENSRSWRLTDPLRRIALLSRRIKAG